MPLDEPVADVVTIAKRDLQPGDRLDEFGGYTFRGLMDTADGRCRPKMACPTDLAPGAEMMRPVASGSVITWDDVRLDETSTVVKLRRQQDAV